jgi:hypothetical protein
LNNSCAAVPRHREIDNYLCKKICRELGIQTPDGYSGDTDPRFRRY